MALKYNLDYLQIDLSDLQISEDEIREGLRKLSPRLTPETTPFIKVTTREYLVDMLTCAEKVSRLASRFNELVSVGIGGSSLGIKTLFHALLGLPGLTDKRYHFLENVDPSTVKAVFETIDWDKTLFIFISKSGKTLETVSLLNAVIHQLKLRGYTNLGERMAFISDPDSKFHQLAKELNAPYFPIPKEIGGRYSVLTPVGLVPGEFFGIRASELLEGARRVASQFNPEEPWTHPAAALGYAKAVHYLRRNRNISVMMIYSDRLRTFADWYAQLWAESLGKAKSRDGREVHLGQTPLPALGTVDQHSLLQLFMEGPDDKVYQLIKVNYPEDVELGDEGIILDYLKGKTLNQVLEAEFHGTLGALREVKRPVAVIEVKDLNPIAMGELFTLYEIATYVASLLFNVNPYDQPGVELGKKIARELLSA